MLPAAPSSAAPLGLGAALGSWRSPREELNKVAKLGWTDKAAAEIAAAKAEAIGGGANSGGSSQGDNNSGDGPTNDSGDGPVNP